MTRLLALCIALLCIACDPVATIDLQDVARLDAGAAAKERPWRDRYGVTTNRASQAVPISPYLGRDPAVFRSVIDPQMRQALPSAILAHSTLASAADRDRYAAYARAFLVAWSGSMPGVDDVSETTDPINAGLHIGLYVASMASTYSLAIKGGWLTEPEAAAVRDWLARMYRLERSAMQLWDCGPACGGPDPCHRFANHAAMHLEAAVAAASAVHIDYMDAALVRWRHLLQRSIYLEGEPSRGCDITPAQAGEVVDRYRTQEGRGYGYSLLTIRHLATVAELAHRHGIDLFSDETNDGRSLALAARRLAVVQYECGTLFPDTVSYGRFAGESCRLPDLALFEHLAARIDDRIVQAPVRRLDDEGMRRAWFDIVHVGQGLE